LAEKTGLSFNTFTKIEQGAAIKPTIQTMIKIADVFQISIDELVVRKQLKTWLIMARVFV